MRYSPDGKWILLGRYWVRLSDGLRLSAIQGGAAINFVQNDVYAFGDDDGNEAGHSLDSENTDRGTQEADVTFMIRISAEENAGGNATYTHALFAQKNGGGGFTEVTTVRADGLKIANDTQSRADDENTTERLTAGAGSFQAGKYDDGQTQQGTTSFKCDTEYTELEFAIQIDSANASNDDYWELRCEQGDGTDYDSYPGNLPKVTADIFVTPSPSVSDGITIGELSTPAMSDEELSVSDGLTIADTPQYYSDDILIGESVNISVGEGEPSPNVSDDITIGESTSVTLPDALAIGESDDITVGDSPDVSRQEATPRTINVSDDVTIGESTEVELPDALAIDVNDGLTIGDAPALAMADEVIDVSDGLTVGDSVTVVRPVAGEQNINVSDDITIGESTSAEHDDETVLVSDGLTVGENVPALVIDLNFSVSDSLTIGDSILTEIGDLQADVTDDITIGENVTVALSTSAISVTDNITVGDNVTISLDDLVMALSDNVTVADAVTVQRVDVSAELDVSVVSGLTLGESVEMYQFAAIIESWTIHSRSQAWTIDDRDVDWSIQDRDTAWTVEDR